MASSLCRRLFSKHLKWLTSLINLHCNRVDVKEIGISLIDSAQDRDYWSALVNAALNLCVL